MPHIKKLCVYPTLGNLPTAYTVSLTFEEQLLEFNKKLNEIIDELNQFSLESIQNMIDYAINNLQNYIDTENKKLYNYTDTQISNSQNYLISLINDKVNYLIQYINTQDNIIKNELKSKFDELDEKINNIVLKDLLLMNPTSGESNNIQDIINNLYDYLRYYGVSANEYDTLGLTADQYDNKNLTAIDYDLYAKKLLMKDFNNYMFNPFTGNLEKLSTVINYLADLHKQNPITALDYDDLSLTATNYDNKEISAYDFDFNAKTLLAS